MHMQPLQQLRTCVFFLGLFVRGYFCTRLCLNEEAKCLHRAIFGVRTFISQGRVEIRIIIKKILILTHGNFGSIKMQHLMCCFRPVSHPPRDKINTSTPLTVAFVCDRTLDLGVGKTL